MRLHQRVTNGWIIACLCAYGFTPEPALGKFFFSRAQAPIVNLQQVATDYRFQSLTVKDKTIRLASRFDTLLFELDTRKAEYNGVQLWLNGPVSKSWGSYQILKADADKTLAPLLAPNRFLASEEYRVVVLDPGQGGEDRGANDLRRGMEEKKMTLDIALKVRKILTQHNIDVRLTRSGDISLKLEERCRLAGRWGADVCVSIHINAAQTAVPYGIETHILPPANSPITTSNTLGNRDRQTFPANAHDGANMILGYMLQRSMLKYSKAEDRGVRRSRFFVIRTMACPTALVECGFLSNRRESENLRGSAYQEKVARGIAEGILYYLNAVKRAHKLKP